MKAVIIDDMEWARKALLADLNEYCPEILVAGEAEGVVSGIKLIKQVKPDIIFLDIHLNDGDGFDILEIIPDVGSRVIFTTASDEHAIRAFRFSAMDYLLKPIEPELLRSAVQKAQLNFSLNAAQVETLKENISEPTKLALHTAEMIKVVDFLDIVRLEAMGNYTTFYFTDKSKLLITKTLKDYDIILREQDFLRVHQSHLINLNHLKAYVKTEGGYILMDEGSRVPVSVRKKALVIQAIDDFAGSSK